MALARGIPLARAVSLIARRSGVVILSPEPSSPSLFESLDAPQATLGLPPIAMLQPGRTPSLQGAELIRLVRTAPCHYSWFSEDKRAAPLGARETGGGMQNKLFKRPKMLCGVTNLTHGKRTPPSKQVPESILHQI